MYLRYFALFVYTTTTTPSPGFPHSPWNPPGVDSFCTWSVSEGLRGSTSAPWCWPPPIDPLTVRYRKDRKDRWPRHYIVLPQSMQCTAGGCVHHDKGPVKSGPKRRGLWKMLYMCLCQIQCIYCDCLPYPRKMPISSACWWPPFHCLLVYSSAAAAIPPKNLPLQTWRPKEVLRLLIGTWFLMICSRLIHVVPRCGFKSTILCANCYAEETEAKQLSIRSISSTFCPPHELKVHHLPGMSCSRKLHQFGSSEWHGRSTKYPAVPPFFLCSWAWVL